jgi:ribosome biogenesis GTPase A
VDSTKAAEVLLHDFRTGVLGRITLETPEGFAAWEELARQEAAEREARRALLPRTRSGKAPSGRSDPRRLGSSEV